MSGYTNAENREYFQGVVDRASADLDDLLDRWESGNETDRLVLAEHIQLAQAEIDHFRHGIDWADGKISEDVLKCRHVLYLIDRQTHLSTILGYLEGCRKNDEYRADPEKFSYIDNEIERLRRAQAIDQASIDQCLAHMRDEIAEREAHASQV